MSETILRTENLTYTYGAKTPFEKTAVNNVNIEIKKGDIIGVIGHTGSGKSTLMQMLNGLITPTGGKVYLDGKDIYANKKELRSVRFKVGLVFQYPENQLFEETVKKDIAFGPKNMGLSEAEIEERILKAAQFAGLREELLERSPFDLSGGEKRRAAIAGVYAMDPQILILDEPTAGLDPMGREVLLSQITSYHNASENTVLLVSHNMEDIVRIADKVLVMNSGKAAMFDTTRAVFSRGDELEAMGMRLPQITKITNTLRQKGFPLSEGILTVGQAFDEITGYLKKEGKL
ncbi:MAG: energy-coupling factor transporter ATPase [Oscillospiraceae bacterium]|nr:energy-coupling factor transporter ATPase [Oscillospiraceae bacterium]